VQIRNNYQQGCKQGYPMIFKEISADEENETGIAGDLSETDR
jgi:hypothetical protein